MALSRGIEILEYHGNRSDPITRPYIVFFLLDKTFNDKGSGCLGAIPTAPFIQGSLDPRMSLVCRPPLPNLCLNAIISLQNSSVSL